MPEDLKDINVDGCRYITTLGKKQSKESSKYMIGLQMTSFTCNKKN